ncbi:hypothetical protein M0804_001448 [Polistes exclamans]|nr:hypothetical protein M0804_001448 [Polistes exclamans]
MNNVTPLVRSHGKAVTASKISSYRILHTQDDTLSESLSIQSKSSDTEVNWSKQVGIGTGEKSVSDDLFFCKGYGVTKCEFN